MILNLKEKKAQDIIKYPYPMTIRTAGTRNYQNLNPNETLKPAFLSKCAAGLAR